jgi:hypothetical protein
MPRHFNKPWTKWDYVNDIMDIISLDNTSDDALILDDNLNRMTKGALIILYRKLKERNLQFKPINVLEVSFQYMSKLETELIKKGFKLPPIPDNAPIHPITLIEKTLKQMKGE